MPICQTVTARSVTFEAVGGLFSGLLEHASFVIQHHQHRVAIGSLDLFQYQFVTTVNWISSFLIFAGGIYGAADSIFIDADDDHAR